MSEGEVAGLERIVTRIVNDAVGEAQRQIQGELRSAAALLKSFPTMEFLRCRDDQEARMRYYIWGWSQWKVVADHGISLSDTLVFHQDGLADHGISLSDTLVFHRDGSIQKYFLARDPNPDEYRSLPFDTGRSVPVTELRYLDLAPKAARILDELLKQQEKRNG